MGFLTDFIKKVKDTSSELYDKTKKGVKSGYETVKETVSDKVEDVQNYFNKDENKAKLLEAVKKACEDGSITAEEVKEITTIRENLDISDADMATIQAEILKAVMEKVKADNKVTPEDEKFIEEVTVNLHLNPESLTDFKKELEKFKNETK